jgi:hypothetical protein
MTTMTAGKRRTVVLLLSIALVNSPPGPPSPNDGVARRRDLFIMYSPNVPRAAARLAVRYLGPGDYVRVESLPRRWRDRVPRDRVYALPTTIREAWSGEPGVRYWVRRGCDPNTPGTLVYDPEHWDLTPPAEQRAFPKTVARAAHLTAKTGCHDFGLAAGATLMYGMAADGCGFRLGSSLYRHVPWKLVDILDIQAQLLLSDPCAARAGIGAYARLVTAVADLVRRQNPRIEIVTQVSLRATPPERASAAINAVSSEVDGVYVAFPTRAARTRCMYCTRRELRVLLEYLRGREPGYWLRAAAMSSSPPSTISDVPVT